MITDISVGLYWSATTNEFTFVFGNISSEMFTSTDTFPASSFYHVAGTYDASTFRSSGQHSSGAPRQRGLQQ